MGVVILSIYYFSEMSRGTGAAILLFFFCLCLLVETARLRSPDFNERMVKAWKPIMRTSEVNAMTGIPFYLASNILAISIFPREIAALSILALAVVDAIASLFGLLYGDLSVRLTHGKSLIGTMAGVIAVAIAIVIFGHIVGLPEKHLMTIALVGGFSAALAELLPSELDDNFTIPLISGCSMWIAAILLHVRF